jgi:hypothetical protein
LNKVIDLLRPEVGGTGVKRPSEIFALIKLSEEFGTEEDLEWCVSSLPNISATPILSPLSNAAPYSSRALRASDLSFCKMRVLPAFPP